VTAALPLNLTAVADGATVTVTLANISTAVVAVWFEVDGPNGPLYDGLTVDLSGPGGPRTLLLTGDRIDAARAKDIGLVGWVVAHDDLLAEAHRLADRLVRWPPLAQRAMKEVAVRSQHLPMLEAIRFGETMRKVVGVERAAVSEEVRRDRTS
jgi:enoyl-CoA hydratase/carnithine racemase